GEGPGYIKIGGRVVYRLEDVEAYEANRHCSSTADKPAVKLAWPGLSSPRSPSPCSSSTCAARPSALGAPPSGSKPWSATMPSTGRCWTPPRAALAILTIYLTACAGVSSDAPLGACPPVVEYNRAEQARVAAEVASLREGALIAGWLADYAVLRNQTRVCSRR
ncbi:hypothetical protein, partial [Pararhodobacter sp. SW119]|uniref:hypothetical protein n=1 Tax=Pararhodobacter sp. SW119 TaxID=2780075 RepID=UPI001FD7B628